MENYYIILSTLILATSFILIANKRAVSCINTFRLQSLLVAITTGVLGIEILLTKGQVHVLLVCLLVFVLKVMYIPKLLKRAQANVEYVVEKEFYSTIPFLILLSCGIVAFMYFILSSIEGINTGPMNIHLVNSVSVVFIGFLFMISRKKAIGQIVGLMVIENGLYITGIFATDGLPLIVDLGVFIDLITAVIILAIMVFQLNREFSSINIGKLKNLKG